MYLRSSSRHVCLWSSAADHLIADVHWAPRGLVTITKKPALDLKESIDYFIIMIRLFFNRIKFHNAIIWFLFELYSIKIFFTQSVKTKFPFPLSFESHSQYKKSSPSGSNLIFPLIFSANPSPILSLQDPCFSHPSSLISRKICLEYCRSWKRSKNA